MIGGRGLKAGIIGSLTFVLLIVLFALYDIAVKKAQLSADYYVNLAIDVTVSIVAGAILGLIFNFIEKLFFFVKYSLKGQVYGLIIGLLLGLAGRGGLLLGPFFYNRLIGYLNIPLISDFIVSLIAGLLWGSIMGTVYGAMAPKKKPAPIPVPSQAQGFLGKIKTSLHSFTTQKQQKTPPTPRPPPGYIVCPRCGTLNVATAKYCRNCGYKLK